MFSRYRCKPECLTQVQRPRNECCPIKYPIPAEPSIPESARIQKELAACTPYIQTTASSNPCLSGNTEDQRTTTTTHDPVLVRSVASSETTRLRAIQQIQEEAFSFEPTRRFQQFFPKQPLPPDRILCPERIPNKVAAESVLDSRCVPQAMFRPSVLPGDVPPPT
jgi:hypothetical protein